MLETRGQGGHIGCSALLVEALALLEVFVELTLCRVLENEVHSRVVVEVAVEPQDVVMPQVRLGNADASWSEQASLCALSPHGQAHANAHTGQLAEPESRFPGEVGARPRPSPVAP